MAEIVEKDRGLQTLLEPEQYETLKDIAHQQGRTISEVLRETVRLGVNEIRKQRRMEALERLNQMRSEIYRSHGMYPGDIVAEVRAEREKQIERVHYIHDVAGK